MLAHGAHPRAVADGDAAEVERVEKQVAASVLKVRKMLVDGNSGFAAADNPSPVLPQVAG
jgi:hypothetical protein